MEAIDDYTIKLNYRNYDSRGVLHRFSRFWQTAGIVSTKVFDEAGVEGMQDIYIGVGAYENVAIGIQQAGCSSFRFQLYLGLGHQKAVAVQDVGWQNVTPGRELDVRCRLGGGIILCFARL